MLSFYHDDKLKKDLIGLGFKNLSNPLMLKTMGKKMSIRRGAKMVGIDNVEKKLEVSFPSSFKSHYFKWNGGDPNLSCFVNDNINYDYIEIRDFIPMKYSKQFEDDPDFTLEGRAINEWKLNELPKNLIPFAFDWGGNYLCLEKNSWQIIYYVRDVWNENISREANFKKNSIIIAKSFDEFLNCLEENPDD